MGEAGKASVLVVDDDERVRTVVSWQLEAEGSAVTHAMNGAGALEQVTRGRPDLVILDLSMPAVGGLDVLRSVRHDEARSPSGLAPLPIIVEVDGLIVDTLARRVTVEGRVAELTAKEFDLLAFLALHLGQVFSRARLLHHVWGSPPGWQDEATVTEHLHRMREKLEPGADRSRWMRTVRGVGYRLER